MTDDETVLDNDVLFPPPRPRHRFESPPQLVCLPCGRSMFGPMTIPCRHILDIAECDICATPGQVIHGSAFRDYEELFSRR